MFEKNVVKGKKGRKNTSLTELEAVKQTDATCRLVSVYTIKNGPQTSKKKMTGAFMKPQLCYC